MCAMPVKITGYERFTFNRATFKAKETTATAKKDPNATASTTALFASRPVSRSNTNFRYESDISP